MNQFRDKVTVITGGASGIGRAICEELGRRGAIVLAADINASGAEEVAAEINQAGGRGFSAYVDVSKAYDVKKLVQETFQQHGRIDYMFNNAGIAVFGEVRDMTHDDWQRILDINLHGVIYGTTEAYQLMVRQGFGHIVNTASLAGLVPVAGLTSYTTTKFAVVGLSTSLRTEAIDLGVKVSVICPGIIRTPIIEAGQYINLDVDQLRAMSQPRMMEVDDAAKIILRGVTRNKAIITFPIVPKILWWFYSICPKLYHFWAKTMFKKVRALRKSVANS